MTFSDFQMNHDLHDQWNGDIKNLAEIEKKMNHVQADLIGISAGFDNHQDDWGGLLGAEDYHDIRYDSGLNY